MDTRFQHFLLKPALGAILGCVLATSSLGAMAADEKKGLKVNSELFDFGVAFGTLSIDDFPTEFVYGANVTFKASEDFFLQYNYFTSDIPESSWETAVGVNYALEDRKFDHFDLLVGYNVFQGEFFGSGEDAHLSNLYVIGGFGETNLGGEENFSYTIGVGYQIEFFRRFVVRLDYRNYIFKSSLIAAGDEETFQTSQTTIGVGYLF